MRVSLVTAATAMMLNAACSAANAAPMMLYTGACKPPLSYTKRGKPTDDLRVQKPVPITCTMANFAVFQNGRRILTFVDGDNVLSFSGSEFVRITDKGWTMLKVDRIQPPLDNKGLTADQILERKARGEGVLDGAEGYCLFDNFEVDKAKQLSCVAQHERGDEKVVFGVVFDVAASKLTNVPGFQ